MAAVRALIFHNGEILMLQRGETISRPGQWCLPGGRIQPEEQPEAAVVRETLEEAGLDVRVRRHLLQVRSCHYYLCELVEPSQAICLHPEECQAFAWAHPSRVHEVGPIMDYRLLKRVIELGRRR